MTATQLRRARERLALTQQQLADALGIHRVTIARWEAGMEPIPRMIVLALLGLVERPKPGPKPRQTGRNSS